MSRHQTSPIQSQKSVTALRLQEVQKKYSELLFKHVMDTYKEEASPRDESPIRQVNGGAKSVSSVRR